MITQTKTILQHIQQDVEVYMEKLKQLEDQFYEPAIKEDERKIELPKEKPTEKKDIYDIEAKVDELLSKIDNKENT
jgi:hypothetical protein